MATNISPLMATQETDGELTILQKHASFFDRNKDGIIYPSETYQALRALGCGRVFSFFTAFTVHLGLSRKTRSPGTSFSLSFPIEVKYISGAMHGSDTGVFDEEGRFVTSKFEDIFSNHARTVPNALTLDELLGMLKANAEPKDYSGRFASFTEWRLLFSLSKDKDGLMHKDSLRAFYDGNLFDQIEKNRASIH